MRTAVIIGELENERMTAQQLRRQCEYMDDQKSKAGISGLRAVEYKATSSKNFKERGRGSRAPNPANRPRSHHNTEPTGISIKFAGFTGRSRSAAVPTGSASF
jgi:hypothetical protein